MAFYEDLQKVASGVLAEFKQGTVLLTTTTRAPADPATPWIPGAETTTTVELDATASGVGQKYVDGTLILASDILVVASVTATVQATGARVQIDPTMSDTLTIDGEGHAIKDIRPKPAAGTPVAFQIFVAN